MSAFTEFLLNTLSGALETAGGMKLIEVLQKLHDKNPEKYNIAIQSGHDFVAALLPIVEASKTKIDDGIVGALEEAINTSAETNGVVFT